MRRLSLRDESVLIPGIRSLLMKYTKNKTLYGDEIVKWCNENLELESKFSSPKLRLIINAMRQQEIPVLSSSLGYWISYDKAEIAETIVSLNGRISSIRSAIGGLSQCVKNIELVDEWTKKGIDI